ncbi:hypothetical protein LOD99_1198 [Oopsacas minuta]|uniref:Uncharacterized protein n=1 Tax=Oopsacas minuta TaxID=111878 RepID=A0AAV7K612_9METZ|nr:hypothetical protein LOD99_1198 [Oopsacas minuta]
MFSHLFTILLLLTQFITQVNALNPPGDTIVIVVVVILIVFVAVLGVFIGIVLCKITNMFGIFNKMQMQSRFTNVPPPPILRPSSLMLPPPHYDDVRDDENNEINDSRNGSNSNSGSDHLSPHE